MNKDHFIANLKKLHPSIGRSIDVGMGLPEACKIAAVYCFVHNVKEFSLTEELKRQILNLELNGCFTFDED